ncbi:hypothetical protein IAU60_000533 [Kwoniella sp. DSM 27419]
MPSRQTTLLAHLAPKQRRARGEGSADGSSASSSRGVRRLRRARSESEGSHAMDAIGLGSAEDSAPAPLTQRRVLRRKVVDDDDQVGGAGSSTDDDDEPVKAGRKAALETLQKVRRKQREDDKVDDEIEIFPSPTSPRHAARLKRDGRVRQPTQAMENESDSQSTSSSVIIVETQPVQPAVHKFSRKGKEKQQYDESDDDDVIPIDPVPSTSVRGSRNRPTQYGKGRSQVSRGTQARAQSRGLRFKRTVSELSIELPRLSQEDRAKYVRWKPRTLQAASSLLDADSAVIEPRITDRSDITNGKLGAAQPVGTPRPYLPDLGEVEELVDVAADPPGTVNFPDEIKDVNVSADPDTAVKAADAVEPPIDHTDASGPVAAQPEQSQTKAPHVPDPPTNESPLTILPGFEETRLTTATQAELALADSAAPDKSINSLDNTPAEPGPVLNLEDDDLDILTEHGGSPTKVDSIEPASAEVAMSREGDSAQHSPAADISRQTSSLPMPVAEYPLKQDGSLNQQQVIDSDGGSHDAPLNLPSKGVSVRQTLAEPISDSDGEKAVTKNSRPATGQQVSMENSAGRGRKNATKRKHTINRSESADSDRMPRKRKAKPKSAAIIDSDSEAEIQPKSGRVQSSKTSRPGPSATNGKAAKPKKAIRDPEEEDSVQTEDEGDMLDQLKMDEPERFKSDTRLRQKKETTFQRKIRKLKAKREGKVVSSSGSGSDTATSDSAEDSQFSGPDEESFIVPDDGTAMTVELPTMFSMDSAQTPEFKFKVVFHYLVVLVMRGKKALPLSAKDSKYFRPQLHYWRDRMRGFRDFRVRSQIWRSNLVKAMEKYPIFDVEELAFTETGCDACHIRGRISRYRVTLDGLPYDKQTHEPLDSGSESESSTDSGDDEAVSRRLPRSLIMGRFCKARAEVFHQLTHWEDELYHRIQGYYRDLLRAKYKRIESDSERSTSSGVTDSDPEETQKRKRKRAERRERTAARVAKLRKKALPKDHKDVDKVLEWMDQMGWQTKDFRWIQQLEDRSDQLEHDKRKDE